jgi:hypothetical protein
MEGKATVHGEPSGTLDEKRVKLPGLRLSAQCPGCKHVVMKDLSRDGLDYPAMNKPFNYGFCCPECDREWDVEVVLTVRLGFPEAPEQKAPLASGRAHYHELLDRAMSATKEGDSFLGRFVDMVAKERS